MNPRVLAAAVVALVVLGSHAIAESRLPRGLVGFTTATTACDAGMLAMTKLCQAEFPSSRMCTSAEVLATQTVPVLPTSKAWVLPTFAPVAGGTSTTIMGTDVSGRSSTPGSLSCSSWHDSDASALTVDQDGRFFPEPGSVPRPVACCAGQPELLGDIDRDGDLDLADSILIRRYLAGELTVLPG